MTDGFGKYDVYAVAGSAYCYKDSRVLKNRFGIRDNGRLRKVEADISVARQIELIAQPVPGRFTATHLQNIHRRILGDVYPFAGRFRREDIAKGTTRFLGYAEISGKLKALLAQLHKEHLLAGLEQNDFVDRAAYYMAELNYIHPFREGNGRAIREFMRLLFLHCGYQVNWDNVAAEVLLRSMVDSVYDTEPLKSTLTQCIEKISVD